MDAATIEGYYRIVSILYTIGIQAMTAFFLDKMTQAFLKQKSSQSGIVGIVYFVSVMLMYFIPYEIENTVVYFIGMVVSFVTMLCVFKGNTQIKLFVVVTFFAVRWLGLSMGSCIYIPISDVAQNMMENMGGSSFAELWQYNFILYVGLTLFDLVVNCIFVGIPVLIIIKTFVYKKARYRVKETIFLLVPAISGLLSYVIMRNYNNVYEQMLGIDIYSSAPYFYGFRFLSDFISIMTIVVVIVLFQNLEQKKEEEQKRYQLQRQIKDIQSHISEIEQLYQQIKGVKHDVKNHVTTVESLIEQKNYAEATKYLSSMNKAVEILDHHFKTGNPITDVIINGKYNEAIKKNIKFQSKFAFPSDTNIDAFDLSIILNNALENAIEASQKGANGFVTIESFRKKNTYLLMVENSYGGSIEMDETSGLPLTSKDDGNFHGMGLINLREVAKKYYGDIEIELTEDRFQLTIMIMIE
ncbi:sensor histidine kinase [Acetobacterium woodii]|uniref:Sensor histidine kinase n=1 Tax=Acetobacterium woodii (strain ATCC 29683 / DSM 1030 / JCM 2381 / KCTC 1655 / WB1) TaxID=931626 RepID=H6LKV6_ACEWD|nr:sensor histidine kinase [Acetobacterium woodii]AFA50065.1 sensor histidine kinase [Acetobacterium woodii DSM 1030]